MGADSAEDATDRKQAPLEGEGARRRQPRLRGPALGIDPQGRRGGAGHAELQRLDLLARRHRQGIARHRRGAAGLVAGERGLTSSSLRGAERRSNLQPSAWGTVAGWRLLRFARNAGKGIAMFQPLTKTDLGSTWKNRRETG